VKGLFTSASGPITLNIYRNGKYVGERDRENMFDVTFLKHNCSCVIPIKGYSVVILY
jgi:hypothetical protein